MYLAACALALLSIEARTVDSGVTRVAVKPSTTDVAINSFDFDHTAFINPKATKRNQLLLFLPGTGGKSTLGCSRFCEAAANAGYHVLGLMYPDAISATAVARDRDPDAMLKFRLEIIEGGDKSPAIQVDRANSIENRLIKALQWLAENRPRENWGQFLTAAGEPAWEKIAPMGLSQGAGHAVLIAYRHKVCRVLAFGGPKDFDRARNKPASWYDRPQTPLRAFFTFNHKQDKQGCVYEEQLEICRTMGLESLGKAVDVDKEAAPYGGSHILFTDYPGTPIESPQAHTSVVNSVTTPIGADGRPRFLPVWEYMLTARVNSPGLRP